jgi:phosphoglycolate phosphatase-like HAD superfamily hydrolase
MRFLLFFLLFGRLLSAELIEIQNIEEFSKHAGEDTLLVFDIDNTIFEPTQTLGTDQWFYHQIDQYVDKGYPAQEALEIALAEWMAIQNVTKVQLVEPAVAKLIAKYQKKGWPLIGLTTRGLGLATRTVEQLQTLGVDLSKSSPIQQDHFIKNRGGVLFRGGILFTAGTNKGSAFFKLLSKAGYDVKKVLFVNDKASHLRDVEKACKKRKVSFTGLRYGFLDNKVQNMRKDLARVQWDHFGKLLSDHDAENLLKK